MSAWRPIEIAKLDGKPVLLFCPGVNDWNRPDGIGEMVVGLWESDSYSQGKGQWVSDIGDVDLGYESTGAYFERAALQPTHWQPLPEPPTKAG